MKRITDADFKYVNAADTAKPGYLMEKFKKLNPALFQEKSEPKITKPIELKVFSGLRGFGK